MLKILKRWLGWDSDSSPFDFSDLHFGTRQRPSPSTIQAPVKPPTPRAPAPSTQAQPPVQQPKQSSTPPKPKKVRAPMDVLDNPKLTLDRPTDDGFDPYNTGAFNRSASWERIGRNKKR